MIDSLFAILSLALGLMLLNTVVLVGGQQSTIKWMYGLSTELRYIVFLSIVFSITLISNQWVAGKVLFPVLILSSLIFLTSCLRGSIDLDRRLMLRDGLSLLTVQALSLVFVFIAFRMYKYWLLEGANHDSLVYYQGLLWANEAPLFVGKEAIRAKWGLGVCGEGSGWIGFNCALYRGGTYTLVAWIQYFAPRVTGNGLYLVAAYSSTMAWFAVRLIASRTTQLKPILLNTALSLVVGLSTGAIGALVNSNLATVMGSTSFVLVLALAFSTKIPPYLRFGLMAVWCAIGTHFYAESVFYSGLLIALLLLLESKYLVHSLTFKGYLRLGLTLLLIVFGLGNIAVGQALGSVIFFSGMKGGEWPSWYLHQPAILWIGSFVAGFLVGKSVLTVPVYVACVITMTVVSFLIYLRATRAGVLALTGLSVLAVTHVTLTHYQYGEHKIVNLLGPAWAFAVALTINRLIDLADASNRKGLTASAGKIATALFICVGLITLNFMSRSASLLTSLQGMHGLDFGLSDLSSHVRAGDTVVIEDSAWINIQKYHRSHYAILQLHERGAKVIMPSTTSDKHRGGYFRGSVDNTLRNGRQIDWLVVSQHGYPTKNTKFLSVRGVPVWENADFQLFRVTKEAISVAGNGWHDCEEVLCWTTTPFEIEAFAPATGTFELTIDFFAYMPPKNSTITVRTEDGKVLAKTSADNKQIQIALGTGWSKLIVEGDWQIKSPKDLGASTGDPRKLFIAVQRVSTKSSYATETK